MIYNKPDYSTGVWANEGNIAYPTSEKIEQGHIVEKPFYEIMNYLQNRADTTGAYILQNGLPDWDRLTEYPIDAYVKHSGVVYKSLSQNEDSEPSPTSQIWKQAFATHEEFLSVLEELLNIKDVDGYLPNYVSKAQPVMTGKAQGVGYTANSGLISTGDESVGYGFNNHTRDGIYHDGTTAVAMNDGVVVGKFTPTREPKAYVTLDVLEEYIANAIRIKVGGLYFTTNTIHPTDELGYGTWQRYAEGKAIVGFSEKQADPDWTKIANNTFGSYAHKLTVEELPAHHHEFTLYTNSNASYNALENGGTGQTTETTADTGGDQPHNNVQPSIVVHVWRRTA